MGGITVMTYTIFTKMSPILSLESLSQPVEAFDELFIFSDALQSKHEKHHRDQYNQYAGQDIFEMSDCGRAIPQVAYPHQHQRNKGNNANNAQPHHAALPRTVFEEKDSDQR